jgi:hypothetical protein
MASETIRPSTCRRRSLLLAAILAAGLSLGKGERAVAATVGLTTRGVLTINGAPVFPIGLSDPPGIGALAPGGQNGLDVVASAGVRVFRVVPPDGSWGAGDNTVLSEVQYAHQWDVAAAKRSALTMVWLARLAQATPGTVYDQTLRQVVTSLAPDAGLGFWKGSDEPFHHGRSASSLAYAYQTTHGLDPAHLTFLIEAARGTAVQLAPYSAVTDVHGVDVYPISFSHPRPSLVAVGDRTALMASITPRHGVSTALQICSSISWDHRGTGGFVLPTTRQMRFMAYDAIMHGARALFFFGGDNPHCFTAADEPLGWNWTYWQQLAPLIRQLAPSSPLYPALLSPGTGIGLRSNDAKIKVISRTTASGQVWILAENRSSHPHRAFVSGLPRGTTTATLFPSGRTKDVTHRTIRATFGPWAVHVYMVSG